MPSMSLVSLLPQPRRRPIRITRLGCRNLLRTFGKLQNKTLTFDAFDIPVIVQNLPPIRGRQRQRPIEFDWMVGPHCPFTSSSKPASFGTSSTWESVVVGRTWQNYHTISNCASNCNPIISNRKNESFLHTIASSFLEYTCSHAAVYAKPSL
jgi:hypothetical protein